MSGVPCKQLRAFASVFERARSRLVSFSRVWSRLVAPLFFMFEHLYAFTSVCERLRACSSAPSRV